MKKTITTITLAIVMTFGATLANAGILVSDRSANNSCEDQKDGIIIAGRDGIIIAGREGIIIAGFTFIANVFTTNTGSTPCTAARDGMLVSD